jgi:hypothetical protein
MVVAGRWILILWQRNFSANYELPKAEWCWWVLCEYIRTVQWAFDSYRVRSLFMDRVPYVYFVSLVSQLSIHRIVRVFSRRICPSPFSCVISLFFLFSVIVQVVIVYSDIFQCHLYFQDFHFRYMHDTYHHLLCEFKSLGRQTYSASIRCSKSSLAISVLCSSSFMISVTLRPVISFSWFQWRIVVSIWKFSLHLQLGPLHGIDTHWRLFWIHFLSTSELILFQYFSDFIQE